MADFLFLEYPKCSTCQNARKWLEEHHLNFTARHIVEDNPTADELKKWCLQSGKPLKSLVNSSGLLYKSMQLKDRLPQMSEAEQLALLATNGMLVKRPLLIGKSVILAGFKEKEWSEKLL